jgi:hypothetical protein
MVRRVRGTLSQHRKVRAETLIHDEVRYWSSEQPLDEAWALPHMLTLQKHRDHSWQREYRFAFGTRANVFDFQNVDCRLLSHDIIPPRYGLDPQCHRLKLRLGSLSDCCRIR